MNSRAGEMGKSAWRQTLVTFAARKPSLSFRGATRGSDGFFQVKGYECGDEESREENIH